MSQYAKYANYVLTGQVEAEAGPCSATPMRAELGAPERDEPATARTQANSAGNCCKCRCAPSSVSGARNQNQHTSKCPMASKQQQQQQHKLCVREASRPSSELSRTSLLGRPLKVETHYRDLRYRKKQNIIYNFLERPRGWRAAFYHFVL